MTNKSGSFSDAKSDLDSLRIWPAAGNDAVLGEVVRVVDTPRSVASMVFQWVPGHCSIPGHIWADVLVYKGSLEDPQPLMIPGHDPIAWETAKQFCHGWMRDQWMKPWTSAPTARVVFRFMTMPVEDDAWKKLDRRDQTVILIGMCAGHADIAAHLTKSTYGVIRNVAIVAAHPKPRCICLGTVRCLGKRGRAALASETPDNCLYGELMELRLTSAFFGLATKGEST